MESFTRTTPEVGDAALFAPPVRGPPGDDLRRLVVRVVEDLDLEAVARPVHRAHRVDHALGAVALVVDANLHAHLRPPPSPLTPTPTPPPPLHPPRTTT